MSIPEARRVSGPRAVVFDLDGVIIDSEHVWAGARRELVRDCGGSWPPGSEEAMIGMSSPEWSEYLHTRLGVPLSAAEISAEVVARVLATYDKGLPLLPGAVAAVTRTASRWPLGLASSSNRPVIDRVLDVSGLASCFRVTVSSEEVGAGKPAPDVYLAAAAALGFEPAECVAVEDSSNGIRSAAAAGLRVVAVPNAAFPASDAALRLSTAVIANLDELTPELVEQTAGAA